MKRGKTGSRKKNEQRSHGSLTADSDRARWPGS